MSESGEQERTMNPYEPRRTTREGAAEEAVLRYLNNWGDVDLTTAPASRKAIFARTVVWLVKMSLCPFEDGKQTVASGKEP